MQTEGDAPERGGISERVLEIAMALVLLAIGGLVVVDSLRLGMRWADDGPQAGYFPFYIGLILSLASAFVLVRAVIGRSPGKAALVEREHLRSILALMVPYAAYAACIYLLGFYVASLAFIGYCMRRMGRHGWGLIAAVSVVTTLLLFLLFEVWFKLPLLKGPLEAALGFA